MPKRYKLDIYGALGEYVSNNDPSLLNEEQLKIANKHMPKIQKLYKKVLKEKKKRKVITFIKEIPEYVLYFIYIMMYWITIPFDYIGNKADDLRVSYGNKRSYLSITKKQKELTDYAYNIVLPLLEEKETDDMTKVQQQFLEDKGIVKKIKLKK
ncbi:membrane protein [Staphylococcus phage CF5]|uniref:Membrane protein n=1 Tax=Staphylococcus phage CF5 TaxID=3113739 RepID=A0AAX4J7D9_9CAUD|nr:membrane protein [Staphylococcus phage CF5]